MSRRRLKPSSPKSRNMKPNSRSQSTNSFRHCENIRKSWRSRRNAAHYSSDDNDDRDRILNMSESLQKMILRLESLVQQQRALAQNNNINRGSDSDSQPEINRDNENREMEQVRETTRSRAR